MSELTERPALKHEVEYSLSFTKNMGNFESLRVNVGLSAEGYGNPSVTLAKVRDFVEENLGVAVQEVSAAIEGN